MKTLILAAMAAAVSLSALSATAVPSKAASVVITTDDDNMRHDDRYWRHHHRDHWRDHRHDRKCRVKIEKHWRNGHPVIREVKVCKMRNDW
jgi:Ni/Co efflux regulator RcnB